MPQILCLSPSPSARVAIYVRLRCSLLLLPRCVIYYWLSLKLVVQCLTHVEGEGGRERLLFP